jgi:DNA polymerase III epsilon subunit-like protein
MTGRRIVIVDTETTGLDLDRARPVEVAYREWPDNQVCGVFLPPHDVEEYAEPEALKVNRYHSRIAGYAVDRLHLHAARLHTILTDAVLCGANPAFDAAMLRHLFRGANLTPLSPWHHRLLDVSAYAAGVLGIPPGELPGLATLCAHLGHRAPDHDAWGDAWAVARVLDVVIGTQREVA